MTKIAQFWDLIESSSFCEDIKDIKDNDDDFNDKEDNNKNEFHSFLGALYSDKCD